MVAATNRVFFPTEKVKRCQSRSSDRPPDEGEIADRLYLTAAIVKHKFCVRPWTGYIPILPQCLGAFLRCSGLWRFATHSAPWWMGVGAAITDSANIYMSTACIYIIFNQKFITILK